MTDLNPIVAKFIEGVVGQEENWRTNVRLGNRFADKGIRAAEGLLKLGKPGKDALARLLSDTRPRVRSHAAAWLLCDRPEEALKVLREVASGKGHAAFIAQQTLKRYEEDAMHLDPTCLKHHQGLVSHFVEGVLEEENWADKPRVAKRYAAMSVRFAKLLMRLGKPGKEAMAELLSDPRPIIRGRAAAWLLCDRPERALEVLREVASGEGPNALHAEQTLAKYAEDAIHLDPTCPKSHKKRGAKPRQPA